MTDFELHLRFPSGAVLVGGYTPTPAALHAAHAADAQGRPLIPATALRGALRETLEALLRGAGLLACSGGDGRLPDPAMPPSTERAPIPCILDNGRRCVACRLFGTRRETLDQDERSFSALVLGQALARATPANEASWSTRPGVSLSRNSHSAAQDRLFFRRIPAARDAHFVARGRLGDTTLRPYLEAAVRGTQHIGAGKSRGMARVDMELRDVAPASRSIALPSSGDILLRVTLKAPASIGTPLGGDDQLRETRSEIPGAALRGAVGFALAQALPSPADYAAFQDLVRDTGARFGFLYPAGDPALTVEQPAAPLPLTALACKHEGRGHGVVDGLLDRLAAAHLEHAGQVESFARNLLDRCGICKGPLRTVRGQRRQSHGVQRRIITRGALDRVRGSHRDEMLFTQVLIEAGAVFEGTIRGIPAASRDVLTQGLNLPLYLGRGRSSGWGEVAVAATAAPLPTPVPVRGQAFDAALKARLEAAQLPLDRVGRMVTVTLLSPLVPQAGDDEDGSEPLRSALGAATTCLLRVRRFSREGGWDQRNAAMDPLLATAPGGVFVFDLGPDRSWRDPQVVTVLEQWEREGVGERRHQGYGQVLCFDPHIRKRTFNKETHMSDAETRYDGKRKALVLAAEQVMREARALEKLDKAQLNRLIDVCGEASCKEEIENYLRYQASRERAPWPRELVEQVIGAMNACLKEHPADDRAQVAAWRLYAVYLTRAFTYRKATAFVHNSGDRRHERR